MKLRWTGLLRAPDDEGAGGGEGGGQAEGGQSGLLDLAADDGQGQDQGGQDDGQGEGQDDGPAKLVYKTRPDWLPPNFWDAKTGEVKVDALAKSQADLRAKISKGADKVPEKPDGYKIEFGEDIDPNVVKRVIKHGEDGKIDDPLLKDFLVFAHDQKLPQDVVNNMTNWYVKAMAEMLPDPVDPKAELAKLGKHGQDMVNGTMQFAKHMVDLGVFTDADLFEFKVAAGTAEGLLMINKLREYYGEKPMPVQTAETKMGTVSADELRGEMAKVMAKAANGDPTAQREYERLMQKYEALYGNDPAGSSAVAA